MNTKNTSVITLRINKKNTSVITLRINKKNTSVNYSQDKQKEHFNKLLLG